jgi:hypothetical protein
MQRPRRKVRSAAMKTQRWHADATPDCCSSHARPRRHVNCASRVPGRPEPAGLVYSERGMLVLPWANLARLRVVEVVKGDVKPRS